MSQMIGLVVRRHTVLCAFACTLALGCGDKDADDSSTSDDSTSDDSAVEGDADTDADSDSDTDADSDADSDTDSDADTDLSYATDIAPILASSCDPCHTSQTSGTLHMTGYDALVNHPSSAGLDYVEPGDSSQSYLWLKLQGTQASVGGSGVQMPRTGTISATDKSTIQTWIDAGAMP